MEREWESLENLENNLQANNTNTFHKKKMLQKEMEKIL